MSELTAVRSSHEAEPVRWLTRREGRRLGPVLAVVLASCGSSVTTHPGSVVPVARPFAGLAQVGALFAGPVTDGLHFCTASVVHSPGRDLLVTAAHCLSGTVTDLVFAPMYHDGTAPDGTWTVAAAYAAPGWLTRQDPHADVAFLRLAPQPRQRRLVNVEDVVGSDRLATSQGYAVSVTVVGFPLGVGGRPVTCSNQVSERRGYPAFDCGGFVGGTSGGPWLADLDPVSHRGVLYGVVGGLHQGGCTAGTSYTSYFDASTAALYRRAVTGGPGDTLPAPGPDGC